jgi:hypothetical protein
VDRAALRREIEECIDAFRRRELTEERLCTLRDLAREERAPRQDLLYLQTASTSLQSPVRGMMQVIGGRLDEGPADPDDWPYRCVLDAIRDGWRVIQFPDLALLMDETRAMGLGCEFILERWHDA